MDAQTRPFDDIRALIGQMPKADEAAREREAELTKPAGSLGRLEEIAARRGHVTGGAGPGTTNRPASGAMA